MKKAQQATEPVLRTPPRDFPVYSLLDAEGRRRMRAESEPGPEEALELFRWMVFGRVFDQRMINLQRQGRIGTIGSIRGQEACAAAMALAMGPEDWLAASYRELLAYIIRGVPVETVIDLYRGRVPGPFPADVRALPIQIVIGTQIPHAAGLAMAARYRGDDVVAVGCCGDGATSEGDFHEGLNFASVYKAPAVFVVQNNGWAISVPRERQTGSATIAQKGWAYGMPATLVDGNDALAMFSAMREALAHARRGDGPVLIEALTYRLGPHTTADVPSRYRSDEEVRVHEAADPVPRLRRFLEDEGLYRDGLQEEVEEDARRSMADAVERVEARPPLAPEEVFDLTYANPPDGWLADRDRALAELERAGERGEGAR